MTLRRIIAFLLLAAGAGFGVMMFADGVRAQNLSVALVGAVVVWGMLILFGVEVARHERATAR